MALSVTPTELPEVLLVAPRVFTDDRGFFLELHRHESYRDAGMDLPFVQDNHSHSCRGTLRGLHYQLPHAQGKLVSVVRGTIFDVAVDIRRGSPRFGKWIGQTLSDENHHQLYVPPGFAHGFCVLSETVDVIYKCTDSYHQEADRGIRWDDPALGIDWQIAEPLLSEKDAVLPSLADLPHELLPVFPDAC